jgi:hypothetical protein
VAEAHTGELPPGTKACVVCGEPINVAATKCIHCQSEQGHWIRRLGMSTSVLSLLVALVAVLGFAIPVVQKALSHDDSDLVFAYQRTDKDGFISVLASNLGTRPGSIVNGSVIVRGGQPSNPLAARVRLYAFPPARRPGTPPAAVLIEPSKSLLLSLAPVEGDSSLLPPAPSKCILIISGTNFRGQHYATSIDDIECADLLPPASIK